MKAIKYLLAGALLFTAVAPTMAQDNKAQIEAATAQVKAKTADVKQLTKEFKKDPEALIAIGKAYLQEKDYDNATKFADLAISAKGVSNESKSKAFILKGDIAVSKDDAGGAAENYQQAKYFNPKEPEGYYKYAMILRGRSPEEAVKNLEDLRTQRPDYPVDALCGRIYYHAQKYENAAGYYGKVTDLSKMEDEDITYYAMTQWLLGNRDKSVEICKVGLTRDPRRAGWNRIAFYNYTDMKDATNALDYADRLFNKSDSAHIIGEDYIYHGTALQLAERWDDAIGAYNKALEISEDAKQKSILYKNLSDVYLKKGDSDNAVAYFEKSIEGTDASMDNLDNLGNLYTEIASQKTQAGDTEGAAAAFKKADEVYGRMATEYPNYNNYCNYMRAQINANLDPDSEQGLAKPYYEALATSLEGKAERNNSENAMLKQAYLYFIGYHFNVQGDVAAAKAVAEKLIVIDPENSVAKTVIEFEM